MRLATVTSLTLVLLCVMLIGRGQDADHASAGFFETGAIGGESIGEAHAHHDAQDANVGGVRKGGSARPDDLLDKHDG